MKKLVSAAAVFLGVMAYSQVTFGLRANALFNTSSANWQAVKTTVSDAINTKGDNSTGYNIGLAAKVKLPVVGLFVMPEIYYTSIKNKATYEGVELEAKNNRIDVPVMVGYDFLLGTLSGFAGPVASYNLSTENTYNNFKENATKDFTVGYQFGLQAKLSKFVVNARYEGAFSDDSRKFIKNVNGTNVEVNYDNRPSMFILGIGYNFN